MSDDVATQMRKTCQEQPTQAGRCYDDLLDARDRLLKVAGERVGLLGIGYMFHLARAGRALVKATHRHEAAVREAGPELRAAAEAAKQERLERVFASATRETDSLFPEGTTTEDVKQPTAKDRANLRKAVAVLRKEAKKKKGFKVHGVFQTRPKAKPKKKAKKKAKRKT